MKNVSRGRETGGHFVLHFGSSLVSLLSLGVNLLGHNGNSQDGRMKVLIPGSFGLSRVSFPHHFVLHSLTSLLRTSDRE